MRYAHIAFNRDLDQTFTYHVPDELDGKLAEGHMVRVQIRTAQGAGIIVGLTDDPPEFTTKPILERLDPLPVVTPTQLQLARWLAEATLTPIGFCLWAMLPPGFTPSSDYVYTLLKPEAEGRSPLEQQIIGLLKTYGSLRGRQLTARIGSNRWQPIAKKLKERAILSAEGILLPPSVHPKNIRTAQLSFPADSLGEVERRLSQQWKRAKLRPYLDILHTLAEVGGALDVSTLYAQTNTSLQHLKKLAEEELIILGESEIWRDSLARRSYLPSAPPPLTAAQAEVWQHIRAHMEAVSRDEPNSDGEVFLIHGVTGSGKTEIYQRATELALAQGRSAIILVPEIALTAQMVARFMSRFGGQVALVHSSLSLGERYDTWRRARAGLIRIVIGARSALFTPLPNVGLIVLDEEHDDSYKQSPPINPPFYQTREAAIEYMRLNHGTVILGSATPDITSYFKAQTGTYTLLQLPNRVLAHQEEIAKQARQLELTESSFQPVAGTHAAALPLPPVQIVDMRQELRVGNTSIFSRELYKALQTVLQAGQQAILFLNRRGSATFVFCRDCGYIARCPRCDTPLTFHSSRQDLLCHHCGYHTPNLDKCPQCSSQRIKYFGLGTEQLERVLRKEFPTARVLRWDADTVARQGAHAEIYETFAARQADVLVGTQMITKGLDLPLVTLVGIISADTALGLPDYRANENTFQLLTQVAGRAGRSLLGGRVILQTYQPTHYAIQAAAEHDYAAFYAREILYRRELRYPPFSRLARLLFSDFVYATVESEAQRVAKLLRQRIAQEGHLGSDLIGPVPCFFDKLDNFYRWHILLRSPQPTALLNGLDVGQHCTIDVDPVDIL